MKKVVNAIIKNSKNEFLLIKRNKKGIHAKKWAYPGGIIMLGESTEDALKREIKEEVGLDFVKIIKKISEYSYDRPNKEKTFGECFFIETKDNDVRIDFNEISDFKWVSLDDFFDYDIIEGLYEEAKKVAN